jgi:D-aminopeptidase
MKIIIRRSRKLFSVYGSGTDAKAFVASNKGVGSFAQVCPSVDNISTDDREGVRLALDPKPNPP